jgi:hypothetical protein
MAPERIFARDFTLVVEIREADRGARARSASPAEDSARTASEQFYYGNAKTFRLKKQEVITACRIETDMDDHEDHSRSEPSTSPRNSSVTSGPPKLNNDITPCCWNRAKSPPNLTKSASGKPRAVHWPLITCPMITLE